MAPALFLTLILLLPLRPSAQSGNVPVGASITATDNSTPWRSPSGDFAFGFQRLPNSSDLFVLSIWFDKIPNRTIAWYETRSYPVPLGSTLRLDSSQGIVLRDPQGRLLYNSESITGQVANGFLNNTGNFVLHRRDSTFLWESFNHPTDTILPTQSIPRGGQLISRARETNYSRGRFYANMNDDGNFVLSTKSFPDNNKFDDEYFNTKTSDTTNSSNSGNRLLFDGSALISIVRQNGNRYDLNPPSIPPSSENYYRVTLDFDGIFALYYHPKNFSGNAGWNLVDSWPDNICTSIDGDTGSGACGYNSICSMESRRPVCRCPGQFSLADPDNPYGDCRPNYAPYCSFGDQQSISNDEYELEEIHDVDWPKNDYSTIVPSTLEQCSNLCLSDCFCGAAIFRSNQCWTKRLPLSNGKVDTSVSSTAFLKIRKNTPSVNPHGSSSDRPKEKHQTLIIAGSVLLSSSVFINCLFITAGCLGFFLIYKKRFPVMGSPQDSLGSKLHCFTYREIVLATKDFKEEVGRGAFGFVYKGYVLNGSNTVVAVKKLNNVAQDSEKEFRTEVNAIGQTHHKNLVCLIGFCNEGPHRVLVYEYMPNGTLASLLFGEMRPSWSERTRIAMGVACGLAYLHEECSTQIIHCDIKPQNILLDEYNNPRISDFGLAKLLMLDQSRTLTNVRGTKGYVAPEWFRNVPVTVKADVYSFGVLLLEIVTCKRSVSKNINLSAEEENPIMVDWVLERFAEGRVDSVVENDEEALSDRKRVERFVMVGIWCVQEDASMRPTMRKVCQMLEGIVEVDVPPHPYAGFSSPV